MAGFALRINRSLHKIKISRPRTGVKNFDINTSVDSR
jgi:hypothetical protein